MKLQTLKLTNFKGIGQFTLAPMGHDAVVTGENGAGKTTLDDAFLWLLFGKDSLDRKEFGIKPVDLSGEPMHGVQNEVEAVLEISLRTLTLKKAYAEKWVKKRGSAKQEFTGHETFHWVDGVPATKAEYEDKISELVDEDVFRLLSNPRLFNESLHWQKRREIVTAVCGDISDADVIASTPELADLPGILGDRTLEDHRKVLAAQRTEINKQLQAIPVRIDEATKGLPDLPNVVGQYNLEGLRQQLKAKQAEKAQAEAGGAMAEKVRQLKELEGEILGMENAHRSEIEDQIGEARAARAETTNATTELQAQVDQRKRVLENNTRMISDLETQTQQLGEEWDKLALSEFTSAELCFNCEQPMPAEKVAVSRANFNQSKASALETIETEAKDKLTAVERLQAVNAKLQGDWEIDDKLFEKLQTKMQEHDVNISMLQANQLNLKDGAYETSEYLEKTYKKAALEQAIEALKAGEIEGPIQDLAEAIADIEKLISDEESVIATVKQREAGLQRIEDLKAQEKTLAKQYEELEYTLYLTELFIRSKVSLLEEKINCRFDLVTFKLFNVQVNGGIEECCEVSYQGRPYRDMSNSERIRAGLDVIRTLVRHYGVACPVFVDNREAITVLPEMPCQVISLVVVEKGPLKVTTNEKEEVSV